jgi:hypothetical protein
MKTFDFITIRLGKDSIEEIKLLCRASSGIQNPGNLIKVSCTQVPDIKEGHYAFIWLGSDNNKGAATDWKQGFKAFGIVRNCKHGMHYNDTSETDVEILYLFEKSVSRLDILRYAPHAYYWCSSMPLIGLDDHANQTIRTITGESLVDIKALFYCLSSVLINFKDNMLHINSEFKQYFISNIPSPLIHGEKKAIDEVFPSTECNKLNPKLTCSLRTKPFLLFAGISGTGKSRTVKELAFNSCPRDKGLDADPTSPGNYCLIEVKPNWHDSTELLGYESALNKSYHLTPFVKFLVKAMCHPHVPFFVCLDEMNLAPVEQYFAEFLSVLESRKTQIGIITSEPLIEASIFSNYKDQLAKEFGISEDPKNSKQTDEYQVLNERIYPNLMKDGLRLPPNLIVIGTVNMDETTHQFSRKVIDRAMTIEMNIGEGTAPFQQFFDGYQELGYRENPLPAELFLPTVTSADEAMRKKMKAEDAEFLKQHMPTLLNELNTALNNTPFKVAYRVQNELVLYFAALRQDYPDKLAEELLRRAMDDILMMKVLPRIQGDEDMLEIPLKSLAKFTDSHNYSRASEKIKEMNGRLEPQHFTSFWP